MSAPLALGSLGWLAYGHNDELDRLEAEWAPFGLPPKVRHILARHGWTVADVAHADDGALLAMRAFWVKSLAAVRAQVPTPARRRRPSRGRTWTRWSGSRRPSSPST